VGLKLDGERPVIVCDRCCEIIPIGTALVLCYRDVTSVSFVCDDPCADAVLKQWKEKGARTMPAVDYFNRLLARYARR